MEPFDFAQSFIERATRAASIRILVDAFQGALERLGFRYYACCSHVDPLRLPRGSVMLHNYPIQWVHAFIERSLYQVDPVLLHAERTLLPFFWEATKFPARLTRQQKGILADAAGLGLARGYTIPIHSPCATGIPRASCSVVPDSASIGPHSYLAVQLMAMYLYDAARDEQASEQAASPQQVLSARERQCLELAAQGKSSWVIGQILSISEHTVHRHIESAKRRLGVATRMQAVLKAFQDGQISIGDVKQSDVAQVRTAAY